jgi:pantoate--beta-alanine ligase
MYVQAVHTVRDIREFLEGKKNIGLVPTMGALHAGHEKLIQTARAECDVLAVSLFVNPLQFGPNEDYGRYPRAWQQDVEMCQRNGVDVIFAPSVEEMYPLPQLATVDVAKVTDGLCGRFVPDTFAEWRRLF